MLLTLSSHFSPFLLEPYEKRILHPFYSNQMLFTKSASHAVRSSKRFTIKNQKETEITKNPSSPVCLVTAVGHWRFHLDADGGGTALCLGYTETQSGYNTLDPN